MGDGGFLINSQEHETAKRLGVGSTTVVFNDNDYGLISWKQDMSRGRSSGTRIGNLDFKAYAESFGIRGCRPQSVDELREALVESIRSRELRLIEVPVDLMPPAAPGPPSKSGHALSERVNVSIAGA
jgi:acetolactate synthase-1/2/3 large subunit